jgi:hypothetical protein
MIIRNDIIDELNIEFRFLLNDVLSNEVLLDLINRHITFYTNDLTRINPQSTDEAILKHFKATSIALTAWKELLSLSERLNQERSEIIRQEQEDAGNS